MSEAAWPLRKMRPDQFSWSRLRYSPGLAVAFFCDKRAIAPTAPRDGPILRLLDSQGSSELSRGRNGDENNCSEQAGGQEEWILEGSRGVGMWMERQDIKFILLSVGLPALLVALVVQLVPQLLRF